MSLETRFFIAFIILGWIAMLLTSILFFQWVLVSPGWAIGAYFALASLTASIVCFVDYVFQSEKPSVNDPVGLALFAILWPLSLPLSVGVVIGVIIHRARARKP